MLTRQALGGAPSAGPVFEGPKLHGDRQDVLQHRTTASDGSDGSVLLICARLFFDFRGSMFERVLSFWGSPRGHGWIPLEILPQTHPRMDLGADF